MCTSSFRRLAARPSSDCRCFRLIDALMALVAWRIGRHIGGLSVARVSAWLYALFLPQVMLAVVPSYDVGATWAFLLPTWFVREVWKEERKAVEPLGVLAGSSAALISAAADYLREHPLAFLWAAARPQLNDCLPKKLFCMGHICSRAL